MPEQAENPADDHSNVPQSILPAQGEGATLLDRQPPDQKKQPSTGFWRNPLPTNKNPNFVHDYFQSSRLHFIGSFRARYESMMVAVGKRLGLHPSVLLRKPPKRPPNRERVIVHIDMDCFFASIAVTKNPTLRGKCIAVCHGGGEISSCSYEARAFGIRAGMFAKNARKICPQLLSVDYDFPSYETVSIQIYSFFHDYPGICVEAVSVDEAYLDITQLVEKDNSQSAVDTLVSNLRTRIVTETGCTASAGIGPSKLVARLATKGAKPNGQLRVRRENVVKYLDTLSVKDLPGIGWRTSKRFDAMSISTVPQLRALHLATLKDKFGERQGKVFHDLARALDSRVVEPLKPRKSIGAEASWGIRFESHETDKAVKFIQDIADEVATRVTAAGAYGTRMVYKVYRKIPNSSMTGHKHLGHGPCSILTKSAKLPKRCIGNAFRSFLRETSVKIHNGWAIRNDEFRGVGLQVGGLTFADLQFDHSSLPVKGTRRIDSFFQAVEEKKTESSGVSDAKKTSQVDNSEICATPLPAQSAAGGNVSQATAKETNVEVDEIEKVVPKPGKEKKEDNDANEIQPVTGNITVKEATRADETGVEAEQGQLSLAPGWDEDVFRRLPRDIQEELLRSNVQNAHMITRSNQAHMNVEVSAAPTIAPAAPIIAPAAPIIAPTAPFAPVGRRRKRPWQGNSRLAAFDKRARRKQSAQITMTQFADISELKKSGHEMLDAAEFQGKPLKEVVELLQDLKPTRKQRGKAVPRNDNRGVGDDTATNRVKIDGINRTGREGFDIPSPPSLSSNSESSYGIQEVVERHGVEHSAIYAEEEIWTYASKLRAWMGENAGDIKSGHVELLRGRILEHVMMKQLDRACNELLVIRKFALEDELKGWEHWFNVLLNDIQNETRKAYGFQLYVEKIDEDGAKDT